MEPVSISVIIAAIAEAILGIIELLGSIESMFEKMPGPEQHTIMRMQRGG